MICETGDQGYSVCELPYPRVVAIDNKRSELENIRDGLLQAGVPCVPLLYDSFEGLKKPKGLKTEHLRYIFLDLNLNDIDEHVPANFVEPISETLISLHVLGAYAIIFWTSYPQTVKQVMELIKIRRIDVPLPFFFDTMDKNILRLPSNPEEGDPEYIEKKELYDSKLTVLVDALTIKLSGNDMFSALLAWENKVSEAASNAVKSLHDTVRYPQPSGVAQKGEDFTRLLKSVASSAWGKSAAKDNWGRSVASGLSPFLSDNLDYSLASDGIYSSVWAKALGPEAVSRLPRGVNAHVLNTSCSLDTTCKTKEAYGSWLEFRVTDNPEFLSVFGVKGESLFGEFINLEKAKPEVDFCSEVRLGIVDITRACDYANRKHGLRRFVLGAIIPASLKENICWPGQESPGKRHEGILRLPEVSIDVAGGKQEIILQVNFKYVLSLPDNSPLLADASVYPLFRVRKQILADIIAKFGAHTTSPGILSFK